MQKIENLLNLWTINELYHAFSTVDYDPWNETPVDGFRGIILNNDELCDAYIYIKANNKYFKLADLSYRQFRAIFERVKNHLGYEENDLLCDVDKTFDWSGL